MGEINGKFALFSKCGGFEGLEVQRNRHQLLLHAALRPGVPSMEDSCSFASTETIFQTASSCRPTKQGVAECSC